MRSRPVPSMVGAQTLAARSKGGVVIGAPEGTRATK
jgi:hypothetical protein